MQKILLVVMVMSIACKPTQKQNIEVAFAKWKNNASGAYSIILDDFGGSWFGDTALIRKSLDAHNIRVTFATVAQHPTLNTDERQKLWEYANTALQQHEFVNHSLDHDPPNFTQEKDVIKAQKIIEAGIQGQCLFLCYPGGKPYTISKEQRVELVRGQKYIGARGGNENGYMNAWNLTDPFKINTSYYPNDGEGIEAWNKVVDEAIATGNWGVRSGHNVEKEAWGTVDYQTWNDHLQYCSQKSSSNDIWIAPVQQVLKYLLERQHFSISIQQSSSEKIVLNFDASQTLNENEWIDNTVYDENLSVILNTGNEQILFDANPHKGEITVALKNGRPDLITQQGRQIEFKPLNSI